MTRPNRMRTILQGQHVLVTYGIGPAEPNIGFDAEYVADVQLLDSKTEEPMDLDLTDSEEENLFEEIMQDWWHDPEQP